MAPGIRLTNGELTISDEDFEDHIAKRSHAGHASTIARITEHFWQGYRTDPYCSTYVVDFLVRAERVSDVFTVLDTDQAVAAVGDPLLRREIQIRRLTLALGTCREAGDIVKAVQTILIGAEAQHDEGAFYDLVDKEVDLSVEFSGPSLLRRTLLDRDRAPGHGSVLAHCALSASLEHDRVGTLHYLRMYEAWVDRRPRRKEGELRGWHAEWKIDDRDVAATVEAVFRISGPDAAIREIQRWTPYEVRLRVALEVVPRLVADGHGKALLDFANSTSPRGPWRLLITVPLALAGFQVDAAQLARDIGRLRARFIPSQDLGFSSTSPSWATQWTRVIVTAIEILYADGGHADTVRKTCQWLISLLTQNVTGLRASDAARVDALMRLWIIGQTLGGKSTEKAAFFEYAHTIGAKAKARPNPVKRKGSKKQSYEREQEQEQTDRKLGVLFGVYLARVGAIEKARAATLTAADVALLGNTTHSYELDSGYEAVYLRQVAARSVSELAFLPNIPYQSCARPPFQQLPRNLEPSKDERPHCFRPSGCARSFTSICWRSSARRDNARQRRTRATEKVADLVTLARFVFPVSRPDAETFFGDAAIIAKDIDDEAIDQIEFVRHASNTASASTPGDHAILAGKFATFVAAASVRLDGHDEFSWDNSVRGLVRLHAPTAFACAGRWMDDDTASLRQTFPPFLLETLSTGELTPHRVAALSLLVEGPDTSLIKPLAGAAEHNPPLIEELARSVLLADGQATQIARGKALVESLGSQAEGRWLAQVRKLVAFAETKPETKSDEVRHAAPERRAAADTDENLPALPFAPAPGVSWRQALENAVRAAGGSEHRGYPAAVLTTISNNLRSPADRVPFLDGLTSIDAEIADASDWSLILSRVLQEWESTPAVQRWYSQRLPALISRHLAIFSRWIRYRQSNLDELLNRTGAEAQAKIAEMFGSIDVDRPVVVIAPDTLTNTLRQEYDTIMRAPIKAAVRSARAQLKQTRSELDPNATNVLLIVNNGFTARR